MVAAPPSILARLRAVAAAAVAAGGRLSAWSPHSCFVWLWGSILLSGHNLSWATSWGDA